MCPDRGSRVAAVAQGVLVVHVLHSQGPGGRLRVSDFVRMAPRCREWAGPGDQPTVPSQGGNFQ